MFLSIGMLKLNYFLADIFILSAEKQPIKLSWRKIECLRNNEKFNRIMVNYTIKPQKSILMLRFKVSVGYPILRISVWPK